MVEKPTATAGRSHDEDGQLDSTGPWMAPKSISIMEQVVHTAIILLEHLYPFGRWNRVHS